MPKRSGGGAVADEEEGGARRAMRKEATAGRVTVKTDPHWDGLLEPNHTASPTKSAIKPKRDEEAAGMKLSALKHKMSSQAGGGLGGVMLLGSSLHDVWRSLPTVSCIGGAGKARAAAFFSMLVIFALLHQLVTTGTATRPSRSPMSQLHSVGGMGGGERASSLVVAGGVQELPPLNLDAWGPPPLSLVDWSLSVATEGGADTKSREKGIGQHKNGTKGGKHHGGKGGKMPPPSMPPPPLPHAPPKLTPRERRFVERAIAAARASGGGNGGDGGDDEAEQKKANGGSGGDGGGGRERSGRGGGDKRGAEGEAGRGGGSSGGGGREKDRDAEGLERVLEKERAQLEKDRARVAEEKRKAAELLAKAKNQYRVFKHPDRYAGRYNFKKVAQQVG